MILDLDDGERAALVALLRQALDDARYPLAPRLAPLKAVLAKLEPPAPADLPMNAYRGPPMTLGNAAAAGVRFVVWCDLCRHQVDLEPADQAACYGAALSVPQWRTRLVCGACGSRRVSMVVAGTERHLAGPG